MFSFFRTASRHPTNEEHDLLVDIYGQNAFIITYLKESHMAVTKQIQDALDRIRQTQSLVASVKQGSDLQDPQIATLNGKITDLQAKLDAGGTIGPDDLGALSEISSDIDTVNTQLQSAIPANTGAAGSADATQGSPQPNAPTDTQQAQQAPQGSQSASPDAGQPAQPADTSKPQPLAGTGQPT